MVDTDVRASRATRPETTESVPYNEHARYPLSAGSVQRLAVMPRYAQEVPPAR